MIIQILLILDNGVSRDPLLILMLILMLDLETTDVHELTILILFILRGHRPFPQTSNTHVHFQESLHPTND